MSSGPGIAYKFGQTGIDDLTSKIKDLHEQFRSGQITYKEYHSSIVEASSQGRAATSEFNQMKGAIAAANPNLLEFTRSMSMFGGVANTVLSVTNAINLAQLAGAGISSELAQTQSQAAAAYNEYVKDLNSYGPADARTVSAWNQYQALLKQVQFEQQQLARESVTTAITLLASGITVASSVAQTILQFKALQATMSPVTAENFAIALSGIGNVMLTWVAPIAIVIAGVEGIYQLIKLLNPAFAEVGNNLEQSIMSNWHVDSIEATLLSPFVMFGGGVVLISEQVHAAFVNLYNGLVNDVLNPLIQAWDSTIGQIAGKIPMLDMQFYHVQTKEEILKSFGLPMPSSGGMTNNPQADAINRMLVGTPTTSATKQDEATQAVNEMVKKITDLANIQTSSTNPALQKLTLQQELGNTSLTDIAASTDGTYQFMLNQNRASSQQSNVNSIQNSIVAYQNSLTDHPTDSALHTLLAKGDNDTSSAGGISQSEFDALNKANKAQNASDAAKIKSLKVELDNATAGLNATLASIGITSTTSGIGSIIQGALGSYAGVGGAGISASELQEFANTHDYGVFTRAANADAKAQTYTQQQQIDLFLKANPYLGDPATHPYLQDVAKQALGIGGTSTTTSVGSGKFGGLPGQYGNPIAAAAGFEGVVSGPTHFLAGEGGKPEQVSISPLENGGRGGGGMTINVTVNNAGSLLAENNLSDFIMKVLKQALKDGGW